MQPLKIESIHVLPERQRKVFDATRIAELASSIKSLGLLQPIVVDTDNNLVAGERRLRACAQLVALGIPIRCAGATLEPGFVPTLLFDDPSELALWEAQLDENLRREDLTWQERAAAIETLHRIRTAQNPDHTVGDTTRELRAGKNTVNRNVAETRTSISVAKHLADPEVAAAATEKDALRILVKRAERSRLVHLAENINVKLLSDTHRLELCDWRMADMPSNSVDVVLTDPPYGMGANTFKDGGDPSQVLHEYDDMPGEEWSAMMQDFAQWCWCVTKEKAHIYVFCDIDKYSELRGYFHSIGFRTHRTPLVYAKSHASSRRVPWPTMGPRRSYELVLYAVKGDRNVNTIVSDVFGPFATDENLGHAAQKPVDAYVDLLRRSVSPGDCVCDPFAGTGTILPAAHVLKCHAVAFERDPGFFAIASERLAKLKGDSK